MKSCMENMIVLMMIIASAWSRIVENSTRNVDDRFNCYPSCYSWQTCCPSGDCEDFAEDCDGCSTEADCGSYEVCCAGECISYDDGCDERTTTKTTTSTSSPTCNDDPTICTDLGLDYCCDKGDGWECMDLEDCMGISEDALWGIGIAAAVSLIAVPILCCCCCGGCALYFILKSRKKRQGQVHQQGYPTAGFVAQQPGYEQGNQAGKTYHGVPNP